MAITQDIGARMANEAIGPIQVQDNSTDAINAALIQVWEQLNAMKGLSGRSIVHDRVGVSTGTVDSDAVTLEQLENVQFADGTQALPGITFVEETDLGLFRSASGEMSVVTANTIVTTFAVALVTTFVKALFSGEIEIDGAFNHDGATFGVLGATPVAQPAAYTQTYSTATRTHSNPTAQDFTDNSGGTPADTLAAITGGGAGCENATKDAVASLARQSDRMLVDVANLKQVVNQILDDLQAFGFFA